MAKKRNARNFDAPQLHGDHPRPVTRRQFVSQGFRTGAAYAVGGGILSAMAASPRLAQAALSGDLDSQLASCGIATAGAGKIPFICFDLSAFTSTPRSAAAFCRA
jgi:cell division protein FtsX